MSQVADFFDSAIAEGADVKLAANWIMGDIAAYMKNEKLSINEIQLNSHELVELISSIKDGTISGKIGKEVYTFLILFIIPLSSAIEHTFICCVVSKLILHLIIA